MTLKYGSEFRKGEVGLEKTGKVARSTESGPTTIIITITTITPPLPPPARLPHHKNTQVLPVRQEVAKRSQVILCEQVLHNPHQEKGPTCRILLEIPRKLANRPETRFSCRRFPECPPTRWVRGLTSFPRWASRTIWETIRTPGQTKPTRTDTIRAASPTNTRTRLTCWTRCSVRRAFSQRNLRCLTIALSTETVGIAVVLAEEPRCHLYPQNHLHLCRHCPNKPLSAHPSTYADQISHLGNPGFILSI